jgi:Sec-independent protein translocase protein TatA
MSFFGMGGFEVMLIGAIALFVLGPKRLLEGIRDGRRMYADLKRQRDTLQSLITEAIDLEDLKQQIDPDGLRETVESLKDDLKLDQTAEELRKASEVVDKSIARDWNFSRPPITVDSEVRDAIPDLNIDGGNAAGGARKAGPPEVVASEDAAGSGTESAADSTAPDAESDTDEVKS